MTLNIIENELLANHTRFRIGGPARYFVTVTSTNQIAEGLKFAADNNLRHFILGNGSNILFSDNGFNGLVLKLAEGEIDINSEKQQVTAFAGCKIGALVRNLAEHDFGGLEFLANIPGSIGGLVYGNAGCYGKSISEILVSVQVYDKKKDATSILTVDEIKFEYRHSSFKDNKQLVICTATLLINPRAQQEIVDEIDAELSERLKKHPHNAYCAGSFFKNQPDYPAWKIITDAGLLDSKIGGAMLSPMHPNFVINSGGATSADVIGLMRKIQLKVKTRLNIDLLPEVIIIDESGNVIQH